MSGYVEIVRADGDMPCTQCQLPYWRHPLDQALPGVDGPYLRIACDGTRIKT